MSDNDLSQVRNSLYELDTLPWHSYKVPGTWVGESDEVIFDSPVAYFLHQFARIDQLTSMPVFEVSPMTNVVYNCHVRHVTAYSHGIYTERDGWSIDGTFLKLTALLPYLHALGVRTLCILPVLSVGRVGRKGTLGSPYAIRNPMRLEESLAEPALGVSVDVQFAALIQAAHAVGVKVVTEFVLRTASIDSDLVPERPEWFYWIRQDALDSMGGTLMPPEFDPKALADIKERVSESRFRDLPEPPGEYVEMFTAPPAVIERDNHGWKGLLNDGTEVRIPGAFADWPPDDVQPAWTDVTYLRFHDHAQYRYPAYNTVRMYERKLDHPEHRQHSLWNLTGQVISFFIRKYGIDGALIDMGHALPNDLRKSVIMNARNLSPGFIFWEETFTIQDRSVQSGYDAVLGYLPLNAYQHQELRNFLQRLESGDVCINYFATPESHNTPRAAVRTGSPKAAISLWAFLRCLPRAVPLIHAGIELGETVPVNTGLGFTTEELRQYAESGLPIFSRSMLPWQNSNEYVATTALVNSFVASMPMVSRFGDDDTMVQGESDIDCVFAFRRFSSDGNTLTAILNQSDSHVDVEIEFKGSEGDDLTLNLKPFEFRLTDGDGNLFRLD